MKIPSNGKDGSTVMSVRKNEAEVSGTSHTVAAGVTTAFDSGELSVSYASGDFIDVRCDLSASTNASTFTVIVTCEIEIVTTY